MARPLGRIADTRIGSDQLSPQQALWRATGLPEHGYTWRDPVRVTPEQRARLEAHVRRYADPPRPPSAAGRRQTADSQARQAAFTAARDAGLGIADAADAAGVSYGTGKRYEAMRRLEAPR